MNNFEKFEFWVPFYVKKVPIWSPFCSKLGPHWVPFLQFLGPLEIWVQWKRELEERNDLGQLDAAAAVAWELINNIVEKTVGGGLCDGGH